MRLPLPEALIIRRPALVGTSPAIGRVRAMAERVAPLPVTVVLTGESGCGKDVTARMIHEESPRAAGPFVAVNCAAIPDQLMEVEFFGCEAGAFTGAGLPRGGLLEEASGGTLFLDEVAELSAAHQAKLLRALQERSARRVGGTRLRPFDVRLIAASNRDLRGAVREGRLRADLYYRLGGVEITLPPLRERKEDLEPLTLEFLEAARPSMPHPLRRVSPGALEEMEAYGWPGNVRELRNVVERAIILGPPEPGDALLPCHLSPELRRGEAEPRPGASPLDLAAAMRRVRGYYLREALLASHGNRTEAARRLGISRRALYDLLEEFPDVPPLSHHP